MAPKREKINETFSLTDGGLRLGGAGTIVGGKVQRTDDPIEIDRTSIASANILDSPLTSKKKGRIGQTSKNSFLKKGQSLIQKKQPLQTQKSLKQLQRKYGFGFKDDPQKASSKSDSTKNVLPPFARSEIMALFEKMARPELERDVDTQVAELNNIYKPPFAQNVVSVLREFQDKPELLNVSFRHPNFASAIVADLALIRGNQAAGYYYTHKFLANNEERPSEYKTLIQGFSSALKEEGTTFTFLDAEGNILSTGSLNFNSPNQPEPPLKNILADPDAAIKTVSLREVGDTNFDPEFKNPADHSTSAADPTVNNLQDVSQPQAGPVVAANNALQEQSEGFQKQTAEPSLGQGLESDVKENVDDSLKEGEDGLGDADILDAEDVKLEEGDDGLGDVDITDAENIAKENKEKIAEVKNENKRQDDKMDNFKEKMDEAEQDLKENKITVEQFKENLRQLDLKFRDDKHAQQIAELQKQIKQAGDNARIQFESNREHDRFKLELRRMDLEAKRLDLREKREQAKEDQREERMQKERETEREEKREEREERRKREDIIDKREAKREERELRKDEQAQKIQLAKMQPKEKTSANFGLSPEQLQIIKKKTMVEIMKEFREKKKKKAQRKGPKDKRNETVNKNHKRNEISKKK